MGIVILSNFNQNKRDKYYQKMTLIKILFLCGSLEPGKDGVGDYTRRLAGELIRQGHSASIISLNDKSIDTVIRTEQEADGTAIPVLRLPSNLPNKKRYNYAEDYIKDFDPEWLILQFVLYSFQKRGLPLKLDKHLAKIGKGRKWYIMFHELWIGITKLSPFTHKITGKIQKRIIKKIVHDLSPRLVTVSNRLYQILLETISVKATILPLFSNISICKQDMAFLNKAIGSNIDLAKIDSYKIFGLFGTLYPDSNIEKTINKLKDSDPVPRKIVLLFFGKNNNTEEYNKLQHLYEKKIIFINIGVCSEQEISSVMQILDKAISSTPKQHLGKSGVYAAFRLHNVPVIADAEDPVPEYEEEITRYNQFLFEREPEQWSSHYIAQMLITILKTN
jgi:hypothetical protein